MVITSPDMYHVSNGEVSIGTLSADVAGVTWSISGDEIQIVDSVMSFIEATDSTVKNQYTEISELIKKITKDDFLKELVIGLDIVNEDEVVFRVRKNQFKVLIGPPVEIDHKFQKFKAFYKIIKRDSLLENYSLINLKYNNQVVATKRETNGA